MNSSQVVRQIVVQRRKEKIQLQVVTGIADNQGTSVASGVSLGWVPEGEYPLEYLNPDGSTVMLKNIKILKPNKASHATP